MKDDLRIASRVSPRKPKVGLLLLAAEWFSQIGAMAGSFAALPGQLACGAREIQAALSAELDLVTNGVDASVEAVERSVRDFARENVDCIVVCPMTWGEDRLVTCVVERLPRTPLLLWCYTPHERLPLQIDMCELFRSSGPVGAVQASGSLKRLGKQFEFVFGSHNSRDAIERIVRFSKANKVAAELKKVQIGILPYRCDQMTCTYVDEFRLKAQIGPALKYLSVGEYRAVCDAIPEQKLNAFVDDLRARFKIDDRTTSAGLVNGARVSLGLAELASQHRLDAIALQDLSEELHRVMGLRPALYTPELFQQAVVSMEADVGASVALWILRALTGKAPLYGEILNFDVEDNCVLIGHAGIHDLELASEDPVIIEPDGEYQESEPDSCWMRFRVKAGEVTMLSLFCDVDGFRMVIAHGECLSGPERIAGTPHGYVRLDVPVPDAFEKMARAGMTQHWAMVHADVVKEVAALADTLGLEKVLI